MAQQHYYNNSRNFFINLSLIFTNFSMYNHKKWFKGKENGLYLGSLGIAPTSDCIHFLKI